MGESPREAAAKGMAQQAEMYATQYSPGAQAATFSQYVNPIIQNSKGEVSGLMDIARRFLNTSATTRMAGLGQQVGESLINGGVAKGQNLGSSWIAQMSPIIGATQEALGSSFNTQAGLVTNLNQMGADSLLKLLLGGQTSVAQMLSAEGQAISGMKNTTGFGDVMGGITTLANTVRGLMGSKPS